MATLLLKLQAQETQDTIYHLPQIMVTAFEYNKKLVDLPAAVNIISQKQLADFNNTSIVPALNCVPGVRMEERSPGSYRVNIRGSALRSPFGVRNVKVYLNDIPFTDPGGNTYLNQLSFYNVQSMEIGKGPSGSMYGAGNGGVLLIKTNSPIPKNGAGFSINFGSFGLQNYNGIIRFGEQKSQNNISYSRLRSDGYRVQTRLKRDVWLWDGQYRLSEKSKINTLFLFGDLFYETPGGLTPAEFAANPKQARPKAGTLPGAEQAKAAIGQQSFFSGINHRYNFSKWLQNNSAFYGAFSRIQNPSIRNYERRTEPNLGARTTFLFTPELPNGGLKIAAGAEIQKGGFNTKVYRNKNGSSDSLQTDDDIVPENSFIFSQLDYSLNQWVFTAGAGVHYSNISITRLSSFPVAVKSRTYKNELAPRLAVLRKLNKELNIYASAAKGFSPPTVAEVLPSTSVISTSLNAESGWNYEAGARWFPGNNFSMEMHIFYFKLNNAIVQRRDASGADYFVNAGSTNQKGLELAMEYHIKTSPHSFLSNPYCWSNISYNDFHYKEFKQIAIDYSGMQLPGVPKKTINAGIQLQFPKNIYAGSILNYVSNIALNDANTFTAAAYCLLSARIGFRKKIGHRFTTDLFASADNLLNENYSLGNDINAASNRFYNPAAKRNFSMGISVFFD
jgi:iron complex outermembrane receptor protein